MLALAIGAGCTRKPKSGVTPIPGYQPEVRTVTVPGDSGAPGDALRGNNFNNQGFRDPNAGRNPLPTDNGGGVKPLPTNPGDGAGQIVNPNPAQGGGELASLDTFEGMVMDKESFKGNTVYFEYDRSRIRSEERAKLAAVAEVLKGAPDNKLLIEGHCDERGTEEYNRALGERRALAAREYLNSLGIKGERVRTVSYGEDRPSVDGHDESAWSKNRRAEFILLKPPGVR